MRSRRIERALACVAGIMLLTHAPAAHGVEQPVAAARHDPAAIPAFAGLIEHHEAVDADGHRIDVRWLLGQSIPINDRIRSTTTIALQRLVAWFGPLPSSRLTIVDAPWSSRALCGSSPGLVVVSSRWQQPELDFSLERALIAGLARQFFRSAPGDGPPNDTFTEALGQFAAVRAINDSLEGRQVLGLRYFGGFLSYEIRAISLSRPRSDPRPFVHQFAELELPGCAAGQGGTPAGAGRVHETAIALLSLERSIGWPALQQAIAALVDRFRGRTLRAADLIAVVAEQRGAAPSPIVVRALSGGGSIDGAIDAFASEPGDTRGAFRTTVRARFDADPSEPVTAPGVTPRSPLAAVPVLIRFADGEAVREWLDVSRPEIVLEYDSPSPAIEASIDPDSTLLFDRDRGNNTRVRSPRLPVTAIRRLLNWLVWVQDLALTGTALV